MNLNPRLLALDCESGGIGVEYALFTGALIAAEILPSGQVIELGRMDFKLKQDTYLVCGEGMRVNQINIGEFDLIAEDRHSISENLKKFLKKHATRGFEINEPVIERLRPLGHSVDGDIKWMNHNFPDCHWDRYVTRNALDTKVIGNYLQLAGVLPPNLSVSLQSLCDHYGIPIQNHDAMEDTVGTLEVFKRQLDFLGEKVL